MTNQFDLSSIGNSLIASVKSDSLSELAQDYSEIGLDSVLNDGLLEDIPVVKTLVAVCKSGTHIRERFLTKKILTFLIELDSLDQTERWNMINRLNRDESFEQDVGESLIELLDRIDSHKKPKMVAWVFKSYAQGQISSLLLQQLNLAIERLPLFEIPQVRKFHSMHSTDSTAITETTKQSLVNAGIAIPLSAFSGMAYKPTDVCDASIRLNLDRCA